MANRILMIYFSLELTLSVKKSPLISSSAYLGMTPLHMAAWAGKDQALKCFLEKRALPNLPSLASETPLHLAAQHGYAACVSFPITYQ